MMWWYGDGNGMGAWGFALMTVSMVVFCGLIIVGVIAWVRYLSHQDRSVVARPTAEQLLSERFARGEIDEQEYRRGLDALRGGPRPLAQP